MESLSLADLYKMVMEAEAAEATYQEAMLNFLNKVGAKYTFIPISELRDGDRIVKNFSSDGRVLKSEKVLQVTRQSRVTGSSCRNYHVATESSKGQCWDRLARVPVVIPR